MKSYGKFEAVGELYQTPVAAIWSARPVGTDGVPGACIKLVEPDAPVFGGNGAAAAEEMLIAAALQQSIANKSEHWAPVYELGYDGKNAFYVCKLFDRSVQRLIDLRIKVTSADLLAIISAIVEGLLDLEAAFNRNHGNLKPANVLIAGKGRIHREDIRLTDPHAGDQEAPSATRSPDAKAIGEIIFALVTGRPHTTARWPVPESSEWDRLGASGLQWLDLCNDLLNTMARQGPMRLSKIQARLSAIRPGSPRRSRAWLLVPLLLVTAGAGYAFRKQLAPKLSAARTWAISLTAGSSKPTTYIPGPRVLATSEPAALAYVPPQPVHPIPATNPIPPVAAVVVPPVIPTPPPPPPPPPVEIVKPTPTPDPVPIPVVQLPAFLPPKAAAKFLDTVSHLSLPATLDARARFVEAVNPLDAQYPIVTIKGDRPWQKELAKLVDAKRESELTLAISALAVSQTPDPSVYSKFATAAVAFNTEAADAEDTINTGTIWVGDSNQDKLKKARQDEESLLQDPQNRATAAPAVLNEIQNVWDAVASGSVVELQSILHDQNSSLPARVAAWQALDLPAMHGHWPTGRADFVSAQKDGDALITAAAGSNINTTKAISDYQDRRLAAFYASLTTESAVTDAVTHLDEIEDGRNSQRPRWLEFDRVLYQLTIHSISPSDAELKQLKALSDLPAAAHLYAALDKARNAAANEQPLKGIGPGLLNWAARPFNTSGVEGCVYSNENCPPIEFIRVEPGPGKGLPFYLSTTEVPVGLIAAVLADSTLSSPAATEALKTLCPPGDSSPGAHIWKYSNGNGIELDTTGYLQYFRQSPTPDLPMQQITPQAAMYLARDLGCRLPTSAEWQSAFAAASNPAIPNDPMKGFATVGWKLRDADFNTLVGRASVTQRFPDDGIFLGPDPSQIPTGSSATTWTSAAVHKLGGWTVADIRIDPQAQRQMAKLDESSSDFRADLIDAPQMGFRPVGTTHHVFHDLVGNVGEIVIDAPSSDMEMLPWGTKITAKDIADWFTNGDRLKLAGVIGGSFLSPPELDPTIRVPFPASAAHPAYADVGFRLAFTDPKVFADSSSVIKHTGYLYPDNATNTSPAK